jgi:hypothetical protein
MELAIPAFAWALMAHGALGGTDVVLHHELVARLPSQPNAGAEQRLHAARELLFALIFAMLAWAEWHGWWVAAIVFLFAAELWVSTIDTIVEWETRVLPKTERIEHVALFINLGIVMTLLGQAMLGWAQQPSGVVAVHYGWASLVLSAMAALSFGWFVRDTLNVLHRHPRA